MGAMPKGGAMFVHLSDVKSPTLSLSFGKYKGTPITEVPPDYLLWLWDNPTGLWQDDKRSTLAVRDYIIANLRTIETRSRRRAVHQPKPTSPKPRFDPDYETNELLNAHDIVFDRYDPDIPF